MSPRLLGGAALLLLMVNGTKATASAACRAESIGVDTSQAYVSTPADFGEGLGETFVASDTLISQVTVWRSAVEDSDDAPMKLWITTVDSIGRPLVWQVLYEGPEFAVPFGDGVHPIEITVVLDPPVVLPTPGKYAFFIQQRCLGFFDLLRSVDDAYPGGEFWRTQRSSLSGCFLRGYPDPFTFTDLVFTIVFCRDLPTPAVRRSWGQLKSIYR